MVDGDTIEIGSERIRLHERLTQLRQLCESLLEDLTASPMREPEVGVKRKR